MPAPTSLMRALFGEFADLTVEEHADMSRELMDLSRRKPSRHVVETRDGCTRAWTDDSASRDERDAIHDKYLAIARARAAGKPPPTPESIAAEREAESRHFERLRSAFLGDYAASEGSEALAESCARAARARSALDSISPLRSKPRG